MQDEYLPERCVLPGQVSAAIQTIRQLIERGHALVMTLSGGKDSSTTTLLCMEAIRQVQRAGQRQPQHFVSSSSTGVENPEIEANLAAMHEDIEQWVHANALPVTVRTATPTPAATFVSTTIGRGTLPRFVENGAKRTCSTSWKVLPQQRLARELQGLSVANGHRETVTVLGTRLDESPTRGASMRRRGDNAQTVNRNADGFLTLAPIAQWSEADVWDFLTLFLDGQHAPFPAFASAGCVRRMLELYRSANEGTCGMFMADGAKAPCGSRFGCWQCTITGERDRSMESMLTSDSRYAYMQGLNDLRNFLVATQWDMSRRELVGRTISEAGYLPVRPDVYSLAMRQNLLRYVLTLDEVETERAEKLDGDVASGRAPATPENQRMREPQFQIVSEADIVLIDFYWSMHHYAAHAFPALAIWYDVKVLGRRYPVPRLATVPKMPIAPKRWYRVGALDEQAPADGLRDYQAELWNRYLHPERPLGWREVDGQRVCWFDEADGLEVDASAAVLFVEDFCEGQMPLRSQWHHAIESARFWLNEEIIKLPAGMAARYQHMARRGQYFAHVAERLNLTPAELDAHLVRESISDVEHNEALTQRASTVDSESAAAQFDMFAA